MDHLRHLSHPLIDRLLHHRLGVQGLIVVGLRVHVGVLRLAIPTATETAGDDTQDDDDDGHNRENDRLGGKNAFFVVLPTDT